MASSNLHSLLEYLLPEVSIPVVNKVQQANFTCGPAAPQYYFGTLRTLSEHLYTVDF